MLQRLIDIPIHVGLRAAKLGLRAARLPLEVAGAVLGRSGDREPSVAPSAPSPVRTANVNGASGESLRGTTPGAAARASAAAAPSVDAGAVDAEPEHVSTGAEVVAEVADAGAEEGAHAEVEVAEPWEGYASMTARDVEQRLMTATAEEIAVVRLYESAHKGRQSVLRATERRMTQQAAERRRPG